MRVVFSEGKLFQIKQFAQGVFVREGVLFFIYGVEVRLVWKTSRRLTESALRLPYGGERFLQKERPPRMRIESAFEAALFIYDAEAERLSPEEPRRRR